MYDPGYGGVGGPNSPVDYFSGYAGGSYSNINVGDIRLDPVTGQPVYYWGSGRWYSNPPPANYGGWGSDPLAPGRPDSGGGSYAGPGGGGSSPGGGGGGAPTGGGTPTSGTPTGGSSFWGDFFTSLFGGLGIGGGSGSQSGTSQSLSNQTVTNEFGPELGYSNAALNYELYGGESPFASFGEDGGGPSEPSTPLPPAPTGGAGYQGSWTPDPNAPQHVATSYGFWADTRGVPNSRATIGANHTVVHFGPDGYVDRILTQPTSSGNPNGSPQYNIPFDPYNPGTQPSPASASGGGLGTMSANTSSDRMPIDRVAGNRSLPTTVTRNKPPNSSPRILGAGEGVAGATGFQPASGSPTTPPPSGGGQGPSTGMYGWGSGGASGNRRAVGGQLWTQFNQLADPNANLDPAYRAALTQEAMGATRSGYADARAQLGRFVADTGNSAGYTSGLAELGRRESNAYGQQARQNTIALETERQRRRELGLSGLQSLYGGENAYSLGLLGLQGANARIPRRTTTNTAQTGRTTGNSRNFNLSFS